MPERGYVRLVAALAPLVDEEVLILLEEGFNGELVNESNRLINRMLDMPTVFLYMHHNQALRLFRVLP